jgi:hypothetical protein
MDYLQVARESLDPPPFIVFSIWRMLSVGLVVVGAIEIAVPFITPLVLSVVSFLAPVFNLVACIFDSNHVMQVSAISIPTMLLWWSDATGRVHVRARLVVRVLTPPSFSTHRGQVLNDSCIQHGLEALDLCVDLLVVFRQQGYQLVEDHPQGQGIVCRCAEDLLPLVQALLVVLCVVSCRASAITRTNVE